MKEAAENSPARLTEAERFFFRHGSYADPPGRVACAKNLARAERHARDHGWSVEWEHDIDPDLSWATREERAQIEEVLVAVLKDASGRVLASVGGVVDPGRAYGRVVEAELALEAMMGR